MSSLLRRLAAAIVAPTRAPRGEIDPSRARSRRSIGLSMALVAGSIAPVGSAVPPHPPTSTDQDDQTPRLAVLLVVDQMRADYLDRFAPLFNGGLARVRTEGRRFANARHLHSATATAPGHTCLSTGSHPRKHGIVANSYREGNAVVRAATDEGARLVTRDAAGFSSKALFIPAIGDWLHEQSPASKVVSIAIKGRAATMLGGKTPDACFYMDDKTGELTTSTRYTTALPTFVERFNLARGYDYYAGQMWERLLSDQQTASVGCTADAMPYEGRLGMGHPEEALFPHPIREIKDLKFTPYGDDRVLSLAEEALRFYQLGGDEHPDLLLVSLSAADYVGHTYGMESVEIAEYYAWLDQRLVRLFAALDAAAGADRWLLALSADHGVSPVVERLQSKGLPAGRVRIDLIEETVDAELDRWFGDQDWILKVTPDLYLSAAAIRASKADPAVVRETAADSVRTVDGVKQSWPSDRVAAGREDVPVAFRYSYHPERSGDVIVQLERHHHLDYLDIAPYVKANHATDQDYDQRIPIVFMGNGTTPGIDGSPIASIDVAPTLATRLGVTPPELCDGSPIDIGGPPK